MIYIVHGEDLASSRRFILNLQEQNNIEVRSELKLDEVSPEDLKHRFESIDMFGGKQMLVLDVSKMGRTNVDSYVEVLENVPSDYLFVVLLNKNLTKTNAFIKNTSKIGARVMHFKQLVETNIFKFADLVFEGNRKGTYKELKKLTLGGEEPIYVFTMLLYNLRNLAFCKFNSPQFNKLSPFVKSKVSKQSQKFSTSQIRRLYEEFYELDLGSKVGTVQHDLLVPMAIEKVLTYF